MKIVFLLSLLFSVPSLACDAESTSDRSEFLKDIKASPKNGEGVTCVNILLESFNPASNRYVHSVSLNIKNEKDQLIAIVSPDTYEAGNGQLIYSACFADNYVSKTILEINSQSKQSIKLENGITHTQSSLLCLKIEQIELGKAILSYSKNNN
ncbi:MAG TPA: hypothetical protein VL995_12865 [Cellvibrio sp.]|nr:hypothetical protein [Cellvibrio sp.]